MMKTVYVVFVILVCFVTAAGAEERGPSAGDWVVGGLAWWLGGALLLIIIGAPVLTVYWALGRSILKPTVTELKRIGIALSGLQHSVGGGVSDQVNQVAQQLYALREALGSKTGGTPTAR